MICKFLCGCCPVRRGPDKRHDALARNGVGFTDHGGICDAWMEQQHGFHFRRRHVESAHDDDVFDAVHDAETTLGVEDAYIAALVPTACHQSRLDAFFTVARCPS